MEEKTGMGREKTLAKKVGTTSKAADYKDLGPQNLASTKTRKGLMEKQWGDEPGRRSGEGNEVARGKKDGRTESCRRQERAKG